MLESEDREIFSQIIKAVRLRDKYVVGGASMHPLEQEAKHPASFSVMALSELATGLDTTKISEGESAEAFYSSLEPLSPESPDALMQMMKDIPDEPKPDSNAAKMPYKYGFVNGVMQVFELADEQQRNMIPVPTVDEFYNDMDFLHDLRSSGPVQTYCFNRLQLIQTKFELHGMVHTTTERNEMKSNCHRDFYNVRKVDTHIHHSAAMNAKFLLRFIRRKARFYGDDVVMLFKEGKPVTLREVFEDLGVNPADLSLDKLNVMADKTTLHRFDRFNAKYSPLGEPMLRTIFMKTDNYMGGRYLAELTKDLMKELEESKYQHTEWRLSIYGQRRDEWDKLARWVQNNDLHCPQNRWMIQIPRLFNIYKASGTIKNFQEMLDNIFLPLFEVTIDPSSHPELNEFLKHVSGFDTVDDESKSPPPTDRQFSSRSLNPSQWNLEDNPSYKYYSFYIYANIRVLNELRARRQDPELRPFDYRPHAGEAGEIHHLDTAFLLADGISHGINLRKNPTLQYLFYITQIGIAVSPCSNNQLFIPYDKNPFYQFFQRGLNVSLSTDDPLMFHQTKEPLMEEYSIAKQIYRLSQADTCEIARNSVLQSGYSDQEKLHWLGSLDRWRNDILKTNVPNIRVRFRNKTWLEEWLVLKGESEVMDSLIQFTTQNLLSSPLSRKVTILPTIPDIDGLPPTKKEELQEFISEDPEMKSKLPPVTPMKKAKQTPHAHPPMPVETVLPMVSGAVFGCIIALALMDIFRKSPQ
jgi:AMP deaminase